MSEQEEIIYPSIVFKVGDSYYAVDSRHAVNIMRAPEYEILPDAPDNVIGIFQFREQIIPLVDARGLFGLPSMEKEMSDFNDMLENRKQDHIVWVKELRHCVNAKEPFTLATDPHKCAFGRWYDHYQTDNTNIQFHLRKIEEPHRKLHEAAQHVQDCKKLEESEEKICVNKVMAAVEGEYMPKIMQLLDDAKEIFCEQHHSMAIVLDDGVSALGLMVDEVLQVEHLSDLAEEEKVEQLKASKYITEIKKSAKTSRLILMVNDDKLREIGKNYQLKEVQTV